MVKPNASKFSPTPPEAIKQSLEGIDIEFLQKFLDKLQQDFAVRDLSQLSKDQAEMLAKMPAHLKLLFQRFVEAKKAKEEAKKENDPLKKKEKEVEEKLEKIAQEALTIACASKLSMNEVLDFHEKCNLGVKGINEFGDAGLNPLSAALAGGRSVADIDKILGRGADINFKSPQGSNAAHFAVMFGVNSEMMNALIERGVDINLKNAFGMTPLDMAVMKGDEKMTEFLVQKGAKLGRLVANKEDDKKKAEEGEGRKLPKKIDQQSDKTKDAEEKLKKQQAEKETLEARQKLEAEAIKQSQIALELAEESRAKIKNMIEKEKGAAAKSKLEKQQIEKQQLENQQEKNPKEALEINAEERAKENKQTLEQQLIEKFLGVELEKIDINKLFFDAALQGKNMVADFLMRMGANVNHKEGGVSVFEAALFSGNRALVSNLAIVATSQTIENALRNSVNRIDGIKETLRELTASKENSSEVRLRKSPENTSEKSLKKEQAEEARESPSASFKIASAKALVTERTNPLPSPMAPKAEMLASTAQKGSAAVA